LRIAKRGGRLHQRIEHRLQVEGGPANDLKHVGCRGLLSERLAQLTEQPHILDRDDRLSGEVSDQLDLLVGEWAHFLTINGDGPDELVRLEHGNED
jgi:hypothetical protein